MDGDARAPKFEMEMEDSEGRIIQPDWTVVVSNKLTVITQQSAMLENQRQMIEELKKLGDMEARETVIKQQFMIVEGVNNLSVHMDQAREELEHAVIKLSGAVMGIIKVPIVVAVVLVASFALYFKYIEEHTWLILLAIAVFPYLGDSITAVAKLFGINRGSNGGSVRGHTGERSEPS